MSKYEETAEAINKLCTELLDTAREVVTLRRERDEAREAAWYLRIILTNMTQDEQMSEIYRRWPWLEKRE